MTMLCRRPLRLNQWLVSLLVLPTTVLNFIPPLLGARNNVELGREFGLVLDFDYDRTVAPPSHGSRHSKMSDIHIGFEVNDVSEVNDKAYTITLSMNTYLQWNDSRIALTDEVKRKLDAVSRDRFLPLENDVNDLVWLPDIGVLHMRRHEPLLDVELALEKKIFLTHDPDFRFYQCFQSVYTINCPMDFSTYPFDRHVCHFEATLNIPVSEGELSYFPQGTRAQDWGRSLTTTILEYDIQFKELAGRRRVRDSEFFSGFRPRVSYAGFTMELRRKSTSYVFNYYLPSALFVVVSWATFVIPVDAIPGRIALIITTFLVLINIANTAFSSSPTADGINLIQVWIISCLGFVFITILEYFLLLYYNRYIRSKAEAPIVRKLTVTQPYRVRPATHISQKNSPLYRQDNESDAEEEDNNKKSCISEMDVDKVDKVLLFAVPPVFAIFNLVYWYLALLQ